VLGLFCEDEEEELDRRVRAACAAENIELENVDDFIALSRDGDNNVLCTFDHDLIVPTRLYQQLETTVALMRPRLLILDVLSDIFAGDMMSPTHVRQFIRTALGGLSKRHDCGVLLVAHPSQTGMTTGEGSGFSTAWNNAVRSRLYRRYPKTDDVEEKIKRRVLEVKKSNYASAGVAMPLAWQPGELGHTGVFVPDDDPIDESSQFKPNKQPKTNTRLAIAANDYFRIHAGNGSVVAFATLFDALQKIGAIEQGDQGKAPQAVAAHAQGA
jgi:RecA-family ATPase